MIDWDGTRNRWNIDHRTDFENRKDFLIALYAEYPSMFKIGRLIYVSPSSVHTVMKEDGVDLLQKGHRGQSVGTKKVLSLGNTSSMTLNQMAKKTGLHRQTCWVIVCKLRLPWKKLKKRKRNLNIS